MPTILRVGPYRIFFYAGDRNEPPHVHVRRDDCEVKFWLSPVRLQWSREFKPKEVRRIADLVEEHQEEIMRSWDEYFHA